MYNTYMFADLTRCGCFYSLSPEAYLKSIFTIHKIYPVISYLRRVVELNDCLCATFNLVRYIAKQNKNKSIALNQDTVVDNLKWTIIHHDLCCKLIIHIQTILECKHVSLLKLLYNQLFN